MAPSSSVPPSAPNRRAARLTGLVGNVWVEASRPKTLPAAVAPVLVGTAAAARFTAWRFTAALVVALAIQVGVNYANDYFDAASGIDTRDRVGPRRVVAAGLVPPVAMRNAMLIAFGIAGLAGVALAAAAGWWLLLVGVVAVLAAVGYSGGPRPYASLGLGEVSVFVFFGLVATVGSQYVQDERLSWLAVVAAVPVGLLVTAILVANNVRDITTDRLAGKATLAVRMGHEASGNLFTALVVGAFALVPVVALAAVSLWPLLALLAAPLADRPIRTIRDRATPEEQIRALAATAQVHLAFGVLLAAGLALA